MKHKRKRTIFPAYPKKDFEAPDSIEELIANALGVVAVLVGSLLILLQVLVVVMVIVLSLLFICYSVVVSFVV
jgi:hypothetical protein